MLAASSYLAAIAILTACGGPSGASSAASSFGTDASPTPLETATPYTPHEPERDLNEVWVTVPDPPPAAYEETLATVTDPRVKGIFDDGKVTIGEERMANNLKFDCYAAAGIVVDFEAANPMRWDGAHADKSYRELSEAIRACNYSGPTDEWMTVINILVPH